MRNYQTNNIILITPDSKVYLRDFNAVSIRVDSNVNCKSLTAELHIDTSLSQSRVFKTSTINSNEIVFDISYYLQSLGAGVTITYIWANVSGVYEDGSTLLPIIVTNRYDEISLSNGYSLPNRQHYSETSVYAPPLAVYKKGMNLPNATEVELEFGAPNTVILNNTRYEKNSSFTIKPDEDCKTIVEVDIQGEYNAWRESNAAWTYGITSIWCNHISVDVKNEFVRLYENAFGVNFQQTDEMIGDWDRETTSQPNNQYFCGVLLRPLVNRPNKYEIIAITMIDTNHNTPQVAYINIDTFVGSNHYYILTDTSDDFLIIDYGSRRGYNRPTYKIVDIDDNEKGTMTFYFYNRNNSSNWIDFDTSIAKGSCYMGVNTNTHIEVMPTPFDRFMNDLGITAYSNPNTPDEYPYDYSLCNTHYDEAFTLELHTLAFGCSTTVSLGSMQVFWLNLLNDADIYATLHDKDTSYSTRFLYYFGGGYANTLTPQVPIYALWYFLLFGRSGSQETSFAGTYRYYQRQGGGVDYDNYQTAGMENYTYSTKQYDNSINIHPELKGVSFCRFQSMSIDVTLPNSVGLATSTQEVYCFPSPSSSNYWRTSEIVLKGIYNGNLEYFDYDGTILNINPDDEWDTNGGQYDYPRTFYVVFQDINNNILNYKDSDILQYNGTSVNVGNVTVYCNSYDDNINNISYCMFPYNCGIPTIQTEDDVLYKYALMPAEINSWGGFSADSTSHTQLCISYAWCSPFNVGRTVNSPNNVPILQTPMLNGWFALSPAEEVPLTDTAITQRDDTSHYYQSYDDFFDDLYNGIEMIYTMGYNYQNTNRPLLSYVGDGSTTINAPCEEVGRTYHDFSKGAITNYKLVTYNICDTDQVFWLKYENMDGFVRWLPFEIKRRVYENTMGDFKFTTPMQSVINAYPMQAPLTLQEKITCFIGDVPQDLYIEDILYSPYLTGISFDGSVSFECVVEENEVIRDSSQELEDFVFNFIKKK